MNQYCVVVMDAARARFFTLRQNDMSDLLGGPELFEHEDLVNPEGTLTNKEIFANLEGRHHAYRGGPPHGYNDHRDQHHEMLERRFARRVARHAADFVHSNRAERCVIAAKAKTLGLLRQELDETVKRELHISELARDLSKLPVTEIQSHLAHKGLLPERRQALA
jgi:protein required for attachment to host cells